MDEQTLSALLVTGGCGFIPSNFINYVLGRLHTNSTKVINYDCLTSAGNKGNVDSSCVTPGQYVLVCGDICNSALFEQVLRRYNIDAVVHFAAETHVGNSYEDPLSFVRSNVQGTVTILEACRAYGRLKRFVYVSTDEVYGDSELASKTPKTELDCLQPTNPYSASKASAEQFIAVYQKSYDFPALIVRLCNAYGPRQTVDKVVPKFIQLAIRDEPFTIAGDGSQLRSFMHVSDICAAISGVLNKGTTGQIYNIGSILEISIMDLAKEIKKTVDALLGRKESTFQVSYVKNRPYNDQRYYMSAEKLKSAIGWKQTKSFQEGLKETVSWYLQSSASEPDRERILIYGANGWIGGQFVSILEKEGVEYVAAKKRPGDDPDEAIEEEILSVSPTHIASFIGRTHGPGNNTVDYLEGGPDKLCINMRDNVYGPLLLAEICRKFCIHFTYIGSGCLFKYSDEHPVGSNPFTEDDRPNYFGSSYSVAKGYTDRLMHHYTNVLNVRMRLPVSSDTSHRNLITKITSYKKILNIPNSVTVLPDLLPVLLNLMKKRHTGTINLVNHGCVEHTQILEAYKQAVDPSIEYELIDENDHSEFAMKLRASRSNCYLSTDRLAELAPEVSTGKEAITRMIEQQAKAKV